MQYLSPSVGLLVSGPIARPWQKRQEDLDENIDYDKHISRGLTYSIDEVVALFGDGRAECKQLLRHDVERCRVARPFVKLVAQRG